MERPPPKEMIPVARDVLVMLKSRVMNFDAMLKTNEKLKVEIEELKDQVKQANEETEKAKNEAEKANLNALRIDPPKADKIVQVEVVSMKPKVATKSCQTDSDASSAKPEKPKPKNFIPFFNAKNILIKKQKPKRVKFFKEGPLLIEPLERPKGSNLLPGHRPCLKIRENEFTLPDAKEIEFPKNSVKRQPSKPLKRKAQPPSSDEKGPKTPKRSKNNTSTSPSTSPAMKKQSPVKVQTSPVKANQKRYIQLPRTPYSVDKNFSAI